MSEATTTARLERMEEKIDKLSEAIVALARVEEKISGLEQSNAILMKQILNIENRTTKNEDAIGLIKIEQATNNNMLCGLKRFFWIFISSALAAGFLVWFTLLSSHQSMHNP